MKGNALPCPKVPDLGEEYGNQAAGYFAQLANGRALPARIDQRERGPTAKPWEPDAAPEWHVTLGYYAEKKSADKADAADADGAGGADDEEDTADAAEASVNENMLAEGLARLEKWAAKKPAARLLVEAQEEARAARRNLWEYGDVDSDDDEPAIKAPGAWGRRK